jgi:hypothetical protein
MINLFFFNYYYFLNNLDKLMPEMFEKACQSNKSNKVHELLTANRFVPIEIKNSKAETGTVIACSHGAVDVLDIFIGYYFCIIV